MKRRTAMATAAAVAKVKEVTYLWEGKDKAGKVIKGQCAAGGQAVVQVTLRRRHRRHKVHKQQPRRGGRVSEKDVSLFTRQMATMMKAGVPLQSRHRRKGHANPAVARLLMGIKTDGRRAPRSLSAFRKYPLHFDALYCNLVAAGEQAGILENLLERLATYKEKILGIKSKIKAALFYPIAIIVVAFIITAVIMIFVIPAFKEVFTNFGASAVMGRSRQYWSTSRASVRVHCDSLRRSEVIHGRRGLKMLYEGAGTGRPTSAPKFVKLP